MQTSIGLYKLFEISLRFFSDTMLHYEYKHLFQCPPCRQFTPELMGTYEKLKADGKKFEVVFISSDRSAESFTSYAETMPWLALPFNDARTQMLKSLYEVEGKSLLIVLTKVGWGLYYL